MAERNQRTPDPAPCDPEVYNKGELVAVLQPDSSTDLVEAWVRLVETGVRRIAGEAHARLDWYLEAGYPQVMHLGNDASYRLAIEFINKLNRRGGVTVKRTYPRGHISAFRRDR